MADDQPLRGVGIELPTPCTAQLLPDVDLPCRRDAEVVCWGPVAAADGSPVVAMVTVCRFHVRPAMRWLKSTTPEPDAIEAWKIDVFAEAMGLGLFEKHGLDLHALRASVA